MRYLLGGAGWTNVLSNAPFHRIYCIVPASDPCSEEARKEVSAVESHWIIALLLMVLV